MDVMLCNGAPLRMNGFCTTTGVKLTPLNKRLAKQLWKQAQHDPDCPVPGRSMDAFERFVDNLRAMETIGYGLIRLIVAETTLLGFVTITVSDERFLPPGLGVVECGTYLLPEFRGLGYNPPTKLALLELAFQRFDCTWAMFVVPEQNERALQAMRKLSSILTEVQAEDERFTRLLDRRAWETGQPYKGFAIHRSSFVIRSRVHW